MTTANASDVAKQPPHRGKVMSWLSKVFELNPQGLNWPRGVMFLDVALVPLVVFWAIGHEQYLLSALFGVLFAGVADPGGGYGYRASRIAVFALIGARVTALGFGIGASGWGWLVLATFAVTLVAGLAVAFGVHRFVAAMLLNVWFIVALGLGFSLHQHARITSYTWAQVLAWAGGAALWIAVTFIEWLIRGRQDRPQPVAEIPGDTSPRKLTRPLITFAVIRALVMAGATALAFGAEPVARRLAADRDHDRDEAEPGADHARSAQRLAGALIGAVAAALLLLIPASEHGLKLFAITSGLEVVAIVLLMHGVAIRFWNYALYTAAIAAGVLIPVDLPQPSNYAAEATGCSGRCAAWRSPCSSCCSRPARQAHRQSAATTSPTPSLSGCCVPPLATQLAAHAHRDQATQPTRPTRPQLRHRRTLTTTCIPRDRRPAPRPGERAPLESPVP